MGNGCCNIPMAWDYGRQIFFIASKFKKLQTIMGKFNFSFISFMLVNQPLLAKAQLLTDLYESDFIF